MFSANFIKVKEKVFNYNVLPVAKDLPLREAVANIASSKGVDKRIALRVANCESKFDPKVKNKNSTAKGLFQFVDGTFRNHCKGDVFNWRDNATCFAEHFNQHPTWWEQCL